MSSQTGLKYLSTGVISSWLIAAALTVMFFYSLAQGVFIDICRSGDCRNLGIHLYPLDRSLFVWGAVFYAAASFLALNRKTNHLLPLVLLAAALGHTGLVVYAWSATGRFLYCSGCITLWSSLIIVTAAAWLVKPHDDYQQRWKAARSFPPAYGGPRGPGFYS